MKKDQILNWLRKGTLGGLLIAILGVTFEAIFELKVQNSYQETVEPYLLTPIQVSFTTTRLQIGLFTILVLLGVIISFFIIEKQVKNSVMKKGMIFAPLELPKNEEQFYLNPTDVITEIVNARQGKINPENLAKTILNAVNSKVITPEAGAETLEEFNYTLILLGDGRFTIGVRKEGE